MLRYRIRSNVRRAVWLLRFHLGNITYKRGVDSQGNHLNSKAAPPQFSAKNYALLNPIGLTESAIIGSRAAPTSPASPPSSARVMMVLWIGPLPALPVPAVT